MSANEALIAAAEKGDLEALKTAIEQDKAFVDYQDEKHTWTALHWACYGGHDEIAQYLCVTARCNPNIVDKYGKAALHVAAKNNAEGCARLLLDRGADVNYIARFPDNSWSPLMYAAKHGATEVAKLLLSRNALTAITTSDGSIAADYAANNDLKTLVQPVAGAVPKPCDVVLSWTPENKVEAEKLQSKFGELGVSCVLAEHPGDDVSTGMAHWSLNAEGARFVLYFLTEQYTKDDLCKAHVGFSDGVGHEAITLLMEDTPFPPEGPIGLAMAGKLYQYMIGGAYDGGINTIVTKVDKARNSKVVDPSTYRHTDEMQCRAAPGLISAVQDKDLDKVRHYVQSGYDLDAGDIKDLWTPLMWACYAGSAEIVDILCNEGNADTNVIDKYGKQALHVACKNGTLDCVRFLCENGADSEFVADFPDNSWTPLFYAANHGHTDVVKYLLGLGVEKGRPLRNGSIAHSVAANDEIAALLESEVVYRGQSEKHFDVFLSYNWTHQPKVKEIRDHLEKAGLTVWMDIGQMEAGDDLFGAIDSGMRASTCVINCVTVPYSNSLNCRKEVHLMSSLRKPYVPIKVDPEVPWPPEGPMDKVFANDQPLDFTDQVDTNIQLLINRVKNITGAAVHQSVPDNRRVGVFDQDLKSAAETGDLDKVVAAIEGGADPNVWDPTDTWSPLHWAAYGDHGNVVQYLCMEARADPNVQDKYGKTALHVACKYGHLEVTRFLIGRGANVNYVSNYPANVWSPLIYAANQGHTEIVKYLLLCGADPAYVCLDYTTAVEKAANDTARTLISDAIRQQQESRARGTKDVQLADIFLSHFSADREVALRVRDMLVDEGFTVWVDEGRSDAADIRDALVDKVMRSCKLVLCIVSDAYGKNTPCIKEIALLDGLKKPAFSLRLGMGAQWPPAGVMAPILAAYPDEVLEVSKDFKPVIDKVAEAAILAGASKVTTSDMIKKKMAEAVVVDEEDQAKDSDIDPERVKKIFPKYKEDEKVTEEVLQYVSYFNAADEDDSETIDIKEMRPLLEKSLSRKVKDKEVKNAMKEVDTDNSGTCDIYEYLQVLKNVQDGKSKGVFSRACAVQ